MWPSALEQALITRFGTLGRVPDSFLLRSDNGLVFTSRRYTALVRGYGLRQEFITPHCPQQKGMVERVIRSLKEQCIYRHRFETHATCQPGHRRLDRLLQPPPTAPSARYENTRDGVRLSGLTCAESAGSLQASARVLHFYKRLEKCESSDRTHG